MPYRSEERKSSSSKPFAQKRYGAGKSAHSGADENHGSSRNLKRGGERRRPSTDEPKNRSDRRGSYSNKKVYNADKREGNVTTSENKTFHKPSSMNDRGKKDYAKSRFNKPLRDDHRPKKFNDSFGENQTEAFTSETKHEVADKTKEFLSRSHMTPSRGVKKNFQDNVKESFNSKSHLWSKEKSQTGQPRKRGLKVFAMGRLTLESVKEEGADPITDKEQTVADKIIKPETRGEDLPDVPNVSGDIGDIQTALFNQAMSVRNHAYAPYSNFPVGAAILAPNGEIYSGCNVENVSLPCGTCAEAGAIAAMIADGETKIEQIVIVAGGMKLIVPCGACLQRLLEFSDDMTLIHLADLQGIQKTFHMRQLLPVAFKDKD